MQQHRGSYNYFQIYGSTRTFAYDKSFIKIYRCVTPMCIVRKSQLHKFLQHASVLSLYFSLWIFYLVLPFLACDGYCTVWIYKADYCSTLSKEQLKILQKKTNMMTPCYRIFSCACFYYDTTFCLCKFFLTDFTGFYALQISLSWTCVYYYLV